MGAMKSLVIDIADTMYQISRDLNEASESSDFDEMNNHYAEQLLTLH